ncbi:unnamed protein product [Adineta ricciae]|uniref:Dolichol kinase n=2 Tax=Adineta ricciae TaxID=249248 RepID=A0A814BGG2_ADIRI|nr:unnamed protein product [Adineta ricciae]
MISTLTQNIVVSLIVTGITFSVVFLLNHLHKRNAITNEVSRKVTHIGAGTLYLALYFYDDRGHLLKYLNIFPNVLWTGILLWIGQRRSPDHRQARVVLNVMTRMRNQHELLRGPLFFNFVMIICGTIFYKTVLGSIIMGTLTWGDGLAAVIGVRYGNQRKIYKNKSLDGSLSFLIAGILASIIYTSILVNFQSVALFKFSVICFSATVVEALTPSDFDNLTIPLCIAFTYFFLF